MIDQETLIEALSTAARAWQDPDYEPRRAAVERTLEAPNRFTEEAVAFAVNQQMALLRPPALARWVAGRRSSRPVTVGVLNAGNVPFVDLQDFLAVVLTGHHYAGALSSKSPALLPAFAEEVRRHVPDFAPRFTDAETLFQASDAIIATGTNETRAWAEARCEGHGIPAARRLLRGHRYAVAVVDGSETEAEREGLAEDALLHEGLGCRSVALVWAPRDLSPDAYLDAFASFRGVFPAHPDTPGALRMQQAFLEAVGQPHAYGEGLAFLLSKGEPDVQGPAHVRWVEYDAYSEVAAWLRDHRQEIQLVVAQPPVAAHLTSDLPMVAPGDAQRPPLGWCPDGKDPIAFLSAL